MNRIYWQEVRRGQRLVLNVNDGEHEEEIGGVRETKRGFDAFAKTISYEPGRSERGIPSLEEAKTFVEQFQPWELYPDTQGLTVEGEVQPPKS